MCNEEMSFSQRFGKRGQDWDYFSEAKVDNKDDYIPTIAGSDIYVIAYDDASFWSSSTPQNRSFLQSSNQTVSNLITKKRMEHAAVLLAAVEKSVNEIATECGYNNPNSFYKAFKRYYGKPPSEL